MHLKAAYGYIRELENHTESLAQQIYVLQNETMHSYIEPDDNDMRSLMDAVAVLRLASYQNKGGPIHNKVELIKAIRSVAKLGLRDAKNAVEGGYHFK